MNNSNEIKNIFYKYKWSYAFLLLCMFIISISSIIPTLIIKYFADSSDLTISAFIKFALIILASGLLSFSFSLIFKYKYTKISITAIEDFVRLLMRKLLYSKWENISKVKIGDLFSVFEKDASSVASNISYILTVCLLEIVKTISMLSVLYYLNKSFALMSLVFIPLLYFIVKYSKSKLTYAIQKRREAQAITDVVISDILLGVMTVKLFNLEKFKLKKLDEKIEDFIYWVSRHRLFESFTYSTSSLISTILSVIVFLTGGYLYVKGEMTIGTLIASYTTILQLYTPIESLFSMSININEVKVSLTRLYKYMDFSPELTNNIENVEFKDKSNLEVNNVSISFDNNTILENVSFKISAPGLYAIIGKSGTGKSTLVNILSKLYNDYTGEIIVDGVSLNEIPHNVMRERISIVSQETFLFNDTISNNLKLGNMNLSDEDIKLFCKEIGIESFIESLPQGYQTLVGEGNHPLSRGEKQRITLIRALLRNPKILILDEATNSLDAENERFFYNIIKKLETNCIIILIAHDLWKVKECKEIFVIKEKQIIESGTHEELINIQGEYFSLYNLQKTN